MDVVLHIGMPKNGSTALQETLTANRDELSKQNIHYPLRKSNSLARYNQQWLAAELHAENDWPRLVRDKYRKRRKDFRGYHSIIDEMEELIDQEGTLVLSSESLFKPVDINWSSRVIQLMDRARSVRIVAYVREPSEAYASRVLQQLRHRAEIPSPRVIPYEKALNNWARKYPVDVIAYDRGRFYLNDIAADFGLRYLGLTESDTIRSSREPKQNDRPSPEVMELVRAFRAKKYPQLENQPQEECLELTKRLSAMAGARFGKPSVQLHPHVREAVNQGQTGLAWLRRAHGIEFSGIDYNNLDEARLEEIASPTSLADIMQIDAGKLAWLSVNGMLEHANKNRAKAWLRRLAR